MGARAAGFPRIRYLVKREGKKEDKTEERRRWRRRWRRRRRRWNRKRKRMKWRVGSEESGSVSKVGCGKHTAATPKRMPDGEM